MWGHLYHLAQHWLARETGSENTPGVPPDYNFWSGFGSILERLLELFVIGGILLRKHNCHQRGCLLIGRFPGPDAQGWSYCRHHHHTAGVQPGRPV